MNTLRKEGDFKLSKESLVGMYNVTDQANDTSLIATTRMRVSDWFDKETADELVKASKENFIEFCEELLKDEY